VIANCFDRLEDHVLPRMRAAGLLATVNTDDPALSDLNLGQEYGAVARAFGYTWDEMVQVALDGVEACWLDESEKGSLRGRILEQADLLRPDEISAGLLVEWPADSSTGHPDPPNSGD
jgi:adenosine deaminase